MDTENLSQENQEVKKEDGSASASPRPWKLWSNSPVDVLDAKGNYVATAEMERDSALIVQAVNSYDALRGALALRLEAAEEVLLEALRDSMEWGRGAHLLSPDILSKDEVWRRYKAESAEHWTKKLAAALSQVPSLGGND